MKLCFSLPSKSNPKVTATVDGCSSKEHKTLAGSIHKYVIPPTENTWRPHKKMKSLLDPDRSKVVEAKLSGSEEEDEVADLGSQEEERCLKKLKDLQLKDKEKASQRSRGTERGSGNEVRVGEKQVLHRCLANLSRVLSFRVKQERKLKGPRCSEATLDVVVRSEEEMRKKQEKSIENPSCTLAIEIPDDLLEEILHRLRVKPLVRLKSVSKTWKSLIESGHLAEKHLCLRQKKYGAEELKIIVERSKSGSFRTKYLSKHSVMGEYNREAEELLRVAGSCNGLVCVYGLAYVYLFNPSTPVSVGRTLTPPQGTKLALLPPEATKKLLSVGFGRDVVTGRYKVAALCSFDDDDERVDTKVFNLSSSEWRPRYKTAGPMPLSFTQISTERNPVFVNGSLFWLLAHGHSEILAMDLHTEKFRTVSTPKGIDVSSRSIYMWSLKDRLCVSDLRTKITSYLDVWVLVQDEVSEWWERSRFLAIDLVIPPLLLNSAWFSPSLVSPYQTRT